MLQGASTRVEAYSRATLRTSLVRDDCTKASKGFAHICQPLNKMKPKVSIFHGIKSFWGLSFSRTARPNLLPTWFAAKIPIKTLVQHRLKASFGVCLDFMRTAVTLNRALNSLQMKFPQVALKETIGFGGSLSLSSDKVLANLLWRATSSNYKELMARKPTLRTASLCTLRANTSGSSS